MLRGMIVGIFTVGIFTILIRGKKENPLFPDARGGSYMYRLPVFVYGSLRPGNIHYDRLLKGKTVNETPARVRGFLYAHVSLPWPCLMPGDGEVKGELIHIAPDVYDRVMVALDDWEDYDPRDEAGSLYLRKVVTAITADGREEQAWCYFWNGSERELGERVEDGDWSKRYV
jgi:gamma-glutamylcyclotransferase (GGCT)/AIG2-like uncharacterized protein YtfP